ncbi:MAG: hypothetical protein PHX41_00550 [Kiritimatiellae bacterium]|jgi:hypothetical protein|nr:hypothetical protein [Kiritimatiellia bacterium]
MENAMIHWAKGVIEYSSVEKSGEMNLDYIGFYAILGGVHDTARNVYTHITLLYIGQAYEQSLRARIPQPHTAYGLINTWLSGHPGYTPVVMIGLRDAVGNKSQSLYDDIECCLIYNNQPLCNDKCKESYNGRAITITNDGDYAPLKQVSVCTV